MRRRGQIARQPSTPGIVGDTATPARRLSRRHNLLRLTDLFGAARRAALEAKERLARWRWHRAYIGFRAEEADAASFDVFDTLITRTWADPRDQFLACGAALRTNGLYGESALRWQKLRQSTEESIRASLGKDDVLLREIYDAISDRLGWDEHQRDRAIQIELEREYKDIRCVQAAAQMMARVQAMQKKIIIASDTYFSAQELKSLLDRCRYDLPESAIYSSGSLGRSKQTGRIFPLILEQNSLPADRLWHIGDNPWSDGRSPAKLGIKSTICTDFQPNRYERMFAQSDGHDLATSSVIAGCARASRLSRSLADKPSQVIWDVSTNIAGPVLVSYVLWTLQEARRRGIERIYFLARDGEVLKLLAEMIVAHFGWPMECNYLYASRLSFLLPSFDEIGEAEIRFIFDLPEIATLESILSRVGIEKSNIAPDLEKPGLHTKRSEEKLSASDIASLKQIFADPEVQVRMLGTAATRREALLAYLRQEGLEDGQNWALCDVGWKASIQALLSKIAKGRLRMRQSAFGIYFGIDRKNLTVDPAAVASFRNDDTLRYGWLIEIFCSSPDPSVERFEMDSGRALPVFAAASDIPDFDLALQREGILHFCRELLATIEGTEVTSDQLSGVLRTKASEALSLLLTDPSSGEANVYGSIAFATDPAHKYKIEIAPTLSQSALVRWILLRGRSGIDWINWPEASFRRSSEGFLIRKFFAFLYRLRNKFDFVRGKR